MGTKGTQEVPYVHEEKLLYFEVGRALELAAQKVVESLSLEILKTCLHAFLCDLLQGTCFSRRAGLHGFPEVPSKLSNSVNYLTVKDLCPVLLVAAGL